MTFGFQVPLAGDEDAFNVGRVHAGRAVGAVGVLQPRAGAVRRDQIDLQVAAIAVHDVDGDLQRRRRVAGEPVTPIELVALLRSGMRPRPQDAARLAMRTRRRIRKISEYARARPRKNS
ncbi:NADH dehydrogenase [Mizugakiibacter sediminis]|uniref:NADH dehydrogenase n=1 Tax=Mizugakiibacter sediminis TaxID=1475481 RepID=A0A0K8QPB4_9GAMM|nr:NADH dehydrogenase [Mizugakiibacter sediminis]